MSATQSDARPTCSRVRSAPLAGTSADEEFFCTRHGDIQQSSFLPRVCVGSGHYPVVETSDDSRSYGETLRANHSHSAHSVTLCECTAISMRVICDMSRSNPWPSRQFVTVSVKGTECEKAPLVTVNVTV